ncbi:hypothetical protein D3C76_1305550 [compost metagenome]
MISLIDGQRIMGGAVFVVGVVHPRAITGGAEIGQDLLTVVEQNQVKAIVVIVFAAIRRMFHQ